MPGQKYRRVENLNFISAHMSEIMNPDPPPIDAYLTDLTITSKGTILNKEIVDAN